MEMGEEGNAIFTVRYLTRGCSEGSDGSGREFAQLARVIERIYMER